MLTNAGMDLVKHQMIEEKLHQEHIFDESHDKAEKAELRVVDTGRPDSCPEVIYVGSDADLKDQFTFVDDGNEASRVKDQRQRFGNLRPANYLVDPETNELVGPKMRNADEQLMVIRGEACWRCTDFQPLDAHVIAEKHARLREVFPHYSIPTGLTEKDCCCTCGAILGLKERTA